MEAWKGIFEMLNGSANYGYDPQKDFRMSRYQIFIPYVIANLIVDRRGTMIKPGFQNMGHASWLTRHCNDIADHAGRKTFLAARASSLPRLRGLRFEVVGPKEAQLEELEGQAKMPKVWFGARHAEKGSAT